MSEPTQPTQPSEPTRPAEVTQPSQRVHAFGEDALGDLDAVGVAAAIRTGELSAREILTAAIRRTEQVNGVLNAVQVEDFQRALDSTRDRPGGPFGGVPTFIKDNNPMAGLPTGNGTAAYTGTPAAQDGVFVALVKRQGLVPIGKTRLPEFGFNASTEYADAPPTRNPWSLGHSAGGSSGGSAALVAAGAVPIAHANDGGGSIRIPAACCGLVGLKPTRGRLACDPADDQLPVRIISEGVVSRSVRDTAAFLGSAELYRPNLSLPPIGQVSTPIDRPLRIGLVLDSIAGHPSDESTRQAVTDTAAVLERLGHHLTPMPLPATQQFADDFVLYWGMLALVVQTTGRRAISPDFNKDKLDNLTKGMAAQCRAGLRRLPSAIYRLRRSASDFAAVFTSYDVILSPVLGHTTPELGYLNPAQSFDQMLDRLVNYVSFTPLNNAAGTPAMSLPLGATPEGLPIGVHFSAAHGDERTLLQLALQLEQARPWRRIQDSPPANTVEDHAPTAVHDPQRSVS